MPDAAARLDNRRRTHDVLSARLAALSDAALAALVAPDAVEWRQSWGDSAPIDVEGTKVFVKKITLTDLERAANGSTANVFQLPLFYQYGVGSAGFGAWRELKACVKASEWALAGACANFPLLYHWRVLPRTPPPPRTPKDARRVDRYVAYWEGSDAVRARVEAMHAATATIVVFLEYAPQAMYEWLRPMLAARPAADAEAAITRMYEQLHETAAFMNARGMLHFDLNAYNVLTDGEQIYAADFGLSICSDFDLTPAEHSFFETHRLYDRAYIEWAFDLWLTNEPDPPVLPDGVSALVERCRLAAEPFRTFINGLGQGSKSTPYPAREIEASLAAHSAGAGGES